MRFLNDLEPVSAMFVKSNWKRDKDLKSATLKFELTLTPRIIKALAPSFQDGIALMAKDKSVNFMEIDAELPRRSITFFPLPGKAEELTVHGTHIDGFYLEKERLNFSVTMELTDRTAVWQVQNFGNQVFFQIFDTQRELGVVTNIDEAQSVTMAKQEQTVLEAGGAIESETLPVRTKRAKAARHSAAAVEQTPF